MNPARAQKLNKFFVRDDFDKLKIVLLELDLMDKPKDFPKSMKRVSIHISSKMYYNREIDNKIRMPFFLNQTIH